MESKSLRHYTLDELKEDDRWKDLAPFPSIGRINIERIRTGRQGDGQEELAFRPKYRVIFPLKLPERRLVREW